MPTKTRTTVLLIAAAATAASAQPDLQRGTLLPVEPAASVDVPDRHENLNAGFLSIFDGIGAPTPFTEHNTTARIPEPLWWETFFDEDNLFSNDALRPAWLGLYAPLSARTNSALSAPRWQQNPDRFSMRPGAHQAALHVSSRGTDLVPGRLTAVAGQPAVIPTSGSAATVFVGLTLMMGRRRR